MSLLASGDSEEGVSDKLATINSELHHISAQEKLPLEAVEAAGLNYDIMPPLPPQRIIEVINPRMHVPLCIEFVKSSVICWRT